MHDQNPPRHTADGSLPYEVINDLFAVGMDVHRALRSIDHDLDPERNLQSVLARLDHTIATVQHGALAHASAAGTAHEQLLASSTFVALTGSLADGFDLNGHLRSLARRGTELPDVRATAFLVGTADGTPHPVVTADDEPSLRALCEMRPSPGWEAWLSGRSQTVTDTTTDIRWPLFAARANSAGHRAVHTTPLRQRENVVGALILFLGKPNALPAHESRVVQVLADLATISVLVDLGGQPREQALTPPTRRV
jgi:GAF domain-containing protein